MGRPRLLATKPMIRERLIEALEAGATRDTAAAYAGIGTTTLFAWLATGREQREDGIEDSVYVEFLDRVEKAEAAAEVYAVATIRRAMADDWKAAIGYLERRHARQWARRTVIEGGDKPIGIAPMLDGLSDDDLDLLEQRLDGGGHAATP